MNKLAGNDLLEVWAVMGEIRYKTASHDRKYLDARARLAVTLVQSWGPAMLLGDSMHGAIHEIADHHHPEPAGDKPTQERLKIGQLVMLAANVVDAVYDEVHRRGWTVEIPPLDELAS